MPQDTLIVIVVAAIVALLIGFLIGKSVGGGNASETTAIQEELKQYKAAVSEHFGKTADLVDNLTSSYKDVFDHLGSSAKDLLDDDEVKKHIASRADKAVVLTYVTEKKEELTKSDAETETPKEETPKEETPEEVPNEVKENDHEVMKEGDNVANVEDKLNKA